MDTAHNTVASNAAATAAAREAKPPIRESAPQPGAAARNSAPPPRPSISQFVQDLRAAFSARFHLFELEAKRAAWSAAYMLAFAVGAALLAVTAWLILIGAAIVGAVAAGVHWVLAVAVAIALHAVAVFFLLRAIRGMVENLTFAGTRRTLESSDHMKGPDVSSN